VTVVAPHLETKCKPECRRKQMAEILGWIPRRKKSRDSCRRLSTLRLDTSPTSVSKVITERLKIPTSGPPARLNGQPGSDILLMPVNMMRHKNDPTGFDVPLVSRKKEAKTFRRPQDYRFEDGNAFDFRGEAARSTDNKGGKR